MKIRCQSIFASLSLIPLFIMGIVPFTFVQTEPAFLAPASIDQEETFSSTTFHSSPVMFVENTGQFEDCVLYKAISTAGSIWLAQNSIWMTFLEQESADLSSQRSTTESRRESDRYEPIRGVNLKLSFLDANPTPKLQPLDRLDTHISYFLGDDPGKWGADLPVWSGVRYQDLYPGIDLELAGEKGELTWRIKVTDPTLATRRSSLESLQLQLEGADAVTLDGDRLRLSTSVGEYRLPLFQVVGIQELPPPIVVGRRVRSPFTSGSFSPRVQDRSMSPQQSAPYSTFLGGTDHEFANAIAVDGGGNAYVVGEVISSDFPVTPGAFDITHSDGFAQSGYDGFVAKISANGTSMVYVTFLGGNNEDRGISIVVDNAYNAYITGKTYSTDFPTTPGAFSTTYNGGVYDAFVTKLNPTGTALDYSSFLGGFGDDEGYDIALDVLNNAYVTGFTTANDFPVTPGAFDTTYNGEGGLTDWDAFVIKMNSTGSALNYGTYLGGAENVGDSGYGIVVDGEGNAFVTGLTESSNFPTTPSAYDISYNGGSNDAFIVKFNSSGSALSYATYLGGNGFDEVDSIALDTNGCIFVTLNTNSTNFPTSSDAFQTAFAGGDYDSAISKLNSSGSQLIYSTYLGGSDSDYARDIAIDGMGYAYVTGTTESTDFPTTIRAFDTTNNGGGDAFGVKLDLSGSYLTYATYFGGSNYDEGTGIAVDGEHDVYVTGYTRSAYFPVTPGAFDPFWNGGYSDAFVLKTGTFNSVYLPIIRR